MPAARRRLAFAALALVAVPLLAAIPIAPADAALKTVEVGSTAFTPKTLAAVLKDSVRFHNGTGTIVQLSYSANWPGSPGPETLAPNATSNAHALTAVGTFTATASGIGVGSSGKVVVKRAAPAPSPTKTSAAPRPSRTSSSPRPSASTSSPATSTSPAPSTGTASTPPIPGFTPPASQSGTPNPASSVAPPSDIPALAGRSQKTLIQPHLVRRLGLPGALSVVLVLGLLFGIGRVLLTLVAPATVPPTAGRAD
jgi:hypothetical protein